MSKEKEKLMLLIQLYKELSYLWDREHEEYRNQTRRQDGYRILLNVYKDIEANASTDNLKKKLQNLRTMYFKEYKKLINALETGEAYEPTLWYFNEMSFLGAGTSHEPSQLTSDLLAVKMQDDASGSDPSISQLCLSPTTTTRKATSLSPKTTTRSASAASPLPISRKSTSKTSVTPKPFSRKTLSPKPNSTKSDVSEPSSTKPDVPKSYSRKSVSPKPKIEKNLPDIKIENPNYEDWEIHGKAIGMQLRNLDKKQLVIALKLISDVVYQAERGVLTETACVYPGTSHSETNSHSITNTDADY